MARVLFINPEYLAAYGDLPPGAGVGRKATAKFHAPEQRPHVTLPTVSILSSEIETTPADYFHGVRALREAGL